MIDKGNGVWPYTTRIERAIIRVITVGLYPWILYDRAHLRRLKRRSRFPAIR